MIDLIESLIINTGDMLLCIAAVTFLGLLVMEDGL